MTWWLKALATIPEGQGSIPSAHMMAHNWVQIQSRESNALFWPPLALHTCAVQAKQSGT